MSITVASILFFTIVLVAFWILVKPLIDFINRITGGLRNEQAWIKISSYEKIVQEVIYYTNDILYKKRIDCFPSFKIYYSQHKKYLGDYLTVISIYIPNHKDDLLSLVDTVLHEIEHFIQDKTNPDFANYDSYTKQLGAWDNPFEIEARQFASENLYDCLKYLETKNVIKRA